MSNEQQVPNVWVVRADGGEETQNCVDGGFTGIGWKEVGDLSDAVDRAAITERYAKIADADEGPGARGQVVGILERFTHEIKVGDWVITPALDSQKLRYGQVTDEYRYEENPNDECRYKHRRNVKWSRKALARAELSAPFFNTLNGYLTVFNARHQAEFLLRIGRESGLPVATAVVVHSLSAHEVALEHILQPKAGDFEHLVGHLFAAMGFETTVTQLTRDGGVDFSGVLHLSNVARVSVVGQVKRYKRGRKIGKKDILDLRGRVPSGAQGVFVTTSDYAKTAREVAEEPGFPPVGQINGEQLVDLLAEHWVKIPEDFRSAIGLKPGLVRA